MAAEFQYKKTINEIKGIQDILKAEEQYRQEQEIINKRLHEKKGRSLLSFFKPASKETLSVKSDPRSSIKPSQKEDAKLEAAFRSTHPTRKKGN